MAKKIMTAGGIGESRNFGAPEAERLKSGEDRMLACHINGVLISQLNLDPQILSALDYFATDEGIAEKMASPNARASSGIEVGKGDFEKALDQRRDDVKKKDIPLWEARDPLKEVADKYAQPGMSPKYLSRVRVKEEGGTGMYQPVKGANGDPVMVKGMILAHAPTEAVEARKRHYQARSNELLKQVVDQHKNENGKDLVDR